jgi:hypothetical protein
MNEINRIVRRLYESIDKELSDSVLEEVKDFFISGIKEAFNITITENFIEDYVQFHCVNKSNKSLTIGYVKKRAMYLAIALFIVYSDVCDMKRQISIEANLQLLDGASIDEICTPMYTIREFAYCMDSML